MQIDLYGGDTATVSPQDYPKVVGFTWRVVHQNGKPYVAAMGVPTDSGNRTTVSLARLITEAPKNKVVIHRNDDRYDFRRENLEVIGRDVLRAMSPVGIDPAKMGSRYRGVSKNRRGQFVATCGKVRIGTYDDEEEAARAYDAAATARFGDRAQRNFAHGG